MVLIELWIGTYGLRVSFLNQRGTALGLDESPTELDIDRMQFPFQSWRRDRRRFLPAARSAWV